MLFHKFRAIILLIIYGVGFVIACVALVYFWIHFHKELEKLRKDARLRMQQATNTSLLTNSPNFNPQMDIRRRSESQEDSHEDDNIVPPKTILHT